MEKTIVVVFLVLATPAMAEVTSEQFASLGRGVYRKIEDLQNAVEELRKCTKCPPEEAAASSTGVCQRCSPVAARNSVRRIQEKVRVVRETHRLTPEDIKVLEAIMTAVSEIARAQEMTSKLEVASTEALGLAGIGISSEDLMSSCPEGTVPYFRQVVGGRLKTSVIATCRTVRTGHSLLSQQLTLPAAPPAASLLLAPKTHSEWEWLVGPLIGGGAGALGGCGIGGVAHPSEVSSDGFSASWCGYGAAIGTAGGVALGFLGSWIYHAAVHKRGPAEAAPIPSS